MAKGLTRNSSPIQVSGRIQESATDTFTSVEIDLTLNALDQEVFVVTQLNLDVAAPDIPYTYALADPNTRASSEVVATLSSTARTTVGSIADSNVIGQAKRSTDLQLIVVAGQTTGVTTFFDREDPLFAPTTEEYIGIIATSNMHINLKGFQNDSPKTCDVRVYGYRAKMDAAGYAALVQSQVLSS
jgi:hypothetical protein